MRVTIKAKLGLAFGVVILLSLAAGVLAIRDLGDLNTSVNELIDGPAKRVALGQQLETLFSNLAKSEKNMILADTDQAMDKYDAEILRERQELKSHIAQLRSIALEAGKADIDKFSAVLDQYITVQDKVRELTRRNSLAKSTAVAEGGTAGARSGAGAVARPARPDCRGAGFSGPGQGRPRHIADARSACACAAA